MIVSFVDIGEIDSHHVFSFMFVYFNFCFFFICGCFVLVLFCYNLLCHTKGF